MKSRKKVKFKTKSPDLAKLLINFKEGFDDFRGEVRKGFDAVDKRFDGVDKRFDENDKKFVSIDKRFDENDKKFVVIDKRFDAIDKRFDSIDKELSIHSRAIVSMDKEIQSLKRTSEIQTADILEAQKRNTIALDALTRVVEQGLGIKDIDKRLTKVEQEQLVMKTTIKKMSEV